MEPRTYWEKTVAFQWDGSLKGVEELTLWVKSFSDKPVWLEPRGVLGIDGQEVWPGDYVIRNMKDYPHVIKAADFEATYVVHAVEGLGPTSGMPIGQALVHLHHGCKVQRAGWNGKGMFIVLMPALQLPPFNSQAPGAKVNDRTAKHIGADTPLDSQPYIAMWTADQKWQPGWLCSQADLLANDWQVVE